MNSIKQIEVIYDNRLVGRLALTQEGLCAFEYSTDWLSCAPLSIQLIGSVQDSPFRHLNCHCNVHKNPQ